MRTRPALWDKPAIIVGLSAPVLEHTRKRLTWRESRQCTPSQPGQRPGQRWIASPGWQQKSPRGGKVLIFRKLDRYDPAMDEPQKLFASLSERYPEPDEEDRLRARARAAIAAIPGIGGSITELMNMVLVPPVARRRDEWLRELAEVVEEIDRKVENFDPATLAENDAFVSAFIRTSRIAIGTHRQEKRRLLRNALVKIGSSSPDCPDEDMQHVYFGMIETLTPSHVQILYLFWTGVSQVARMHQGTIPIHMTYGELLEIQNPALARSQELLEQILHDLADLRLVNASSGTPFQQISLSTQLMTNQGIRFLGFVLAPEDLPS